MQIPKFDKIITIAIISILAVGIFAYFSKDFRGHLQTGSKTAPSIETQAP